MLLRRLLLLVIILALVGYFVMRRLIDIYSPTPTDLGVQNGQLRPCPDSPNCVSSYSSEPVHAIEALPYTSSPGEMQAKLLAVLQGMPRADIITVQSHYVHVELRTQLMRFVDDAEFYFDEANGLLHMRAGSRLGKGDLGVNRRNLEQIRAALAQ